MRILHFGIERIFYGEQTRFLHQLVTRNRIQKLCTHTTQHSNRFKIEWHHLGDCVVIYLVSRNRFPCVLKVAEVAPEIPHERGLRSCRLRSRPASIPPLFRMSADYCGHPERFKWILFKLKIHFVIGYFLNTWCGGSYSVDWTTGDPSARRSSMQALATSSWTSSGWTLFSLAFCCWMETTFMSNCHS